MALLETKMQDQLVLLNDFLFNRVIEVPAVGNAGGLSVLWDDSVLELDEVATTDQEIHAIIKNIWLARNNNIFNDNFMPIPIREPYEKSIEFLFMAVQRSVRKNHAKQQWTPPAHKLKLNIDGSFDYKSGK
ncbi:hypothetical protein FXO37_11637 [Capsicum annuum]|nr:hypothetical protein FXO37_11637 [Capsicum annuum]